MAKKTKSRPPKDWLHHIVELEQAPNDTPDSVDSVEHAVIAQHEEEQSEAVSADSPWYKRDKVYPIGAVIACSALLLGWVLCSVFLSKITVGNAVIPAHSSDTALALTLNKQVAAYKLTIQYPDGKKQQYPLSKLGLKLNTAASTQAARKSQHKTNQRLEWWKPIQAPLVFKADKPTFDSFVASATNVTVQPSQDAVLSMQGGQITITNAVTGKRYGLGQPEVLVSAASNLQKGPVKLKTLVVRPALTASILEPYKAKLNKIINQPVTFTVGETILKPTSKDIANWLEITPDAKSKKVDITVNSGKVLEYINAAVADDIHPPRTEVIINQPDGGTLLAVPGTNGVDITNKSAVSISVAKRLLGGDGINLPLSISYQPFQTITTNSYDKWIEVDLTTKRMYAYEKSSIVRTELVSAGVPQTPTVTGQYAIYAKYASQDMKGSNVDGSNYFQPNVQWINYFYRDYAIHGNYWRPLSYFGNINSSHGCVSMPDNEAEWVYSWAPIGTPVIIHT